MSSQLISVKLPDSQTPNHLWSMVKVFSHIFKGHNFQHTITAPQRLATLVNVAVSAPQHIPITHHSFFTFWAWHHCFKCPVCNLLSLHLLSCALRSRRSFIFLSQDQISYLLALLFHPAIGKTWVLWYFHQGLMSWTDPFAHGKLRSLHSPPIRADSARTVLGLCSDFFGWESCQTGQPVRANS